MQRPLLDPAMHPRQDTPEAPVADQELLNAYVASRAPADFRRIVDRHAPLVLRTAQRLVGNWHDAEEVSQAVFLVLAQRAGSVNNTLVGWLYKVTRDVALQLLRARSRRARREETAVRNKAQTTAATEHGLREELDAVLMALPERMREAVILRHLEGRGQEEAARLAGCDKGTLSRRCTEGLNRLAALLTRRGVVVAPAVLTAFLASQATAAVPATALTAVQGVASAGVASAQASLLAKGAVNAMFWAKAKLCAAVVVAASVVGGGVVAPLVLSSPAAPQAPPVLTFDFEDGKLPALCTLGSVVPTPNNPGNRFALEGGPFGPNGGKNKVFFERDTGLFNYADDLALVFDVRVSGPVSTVDLHLWNATQQASQGVEPPVSVKPDQWQTGVKIRFADFKANGRGPRAGDLIASLAIQVGQAGGTIWIDNLAIVHDGPR